jgi:hypothetical protein
MRCVRCNAKLSFDEEYYTKVVDGEQIYPELCFRCQGVPERDYEDIYRDEEYWGNAWPDQE